jgi:hypothetical protein
MTVADDILDQVHREAGLTATEIAVRVYGRRSYQQKVGQNCRRLVETGRLEAMAKAARAIHSLITLLPSESAGRDTRGRRGLEAVMGLSARELDKKDDPKYWQSRAAEARAVAVQMKDAHTKAVMLGIAQDYEKSDDRSPFPAALVNRRIGSLLFREGRAPAKSSRIL